MKTFGLLLAMIPAMIIATLFSVPANAQATRTWVSGVGDDANPCSRTAPCKTFAGAISKTAAGGEINVLDPGGFGAVTITKSIQIRSESIEAGVLETYRNGPVVFARALIFARAGMRWVGLSSRGLSHPAPTSSRQATPLLLFQQ